MSRRLWLPLLILLVLVAIPFRASVFGLVALATLSAGWLYDRFGWVTLNLAVVPLLVAVLIGTVNIERRLRQNAPAA